MKFVVIVDDSEVTQLPPGVLEQMLHKEMMAQLERVFLHGTTVEERMRGFIKDFIESPQGQHIVRPRRRKGPPSRDARKDRWCR